MYVKIMSAQNLPDHHGGKEYWLIECSRVSFARADDGSPIAYIDSTEHPCPGNVYVLNAAGKTIESFSFNAPLVPQGFGDPAPTRPAV